MANYITRRDRMTGYEVLRQGGEGIHLRVRKYTIAKFVTRVDQFNSDRAIVDVAVATPETFSRVPCALTLVDKGVQCSIFVYEEVGADAR